MYRALVIFLSEIIDAMNPGRNPAVTVKLEVTVSGLSSAKTRGHYLYRRNFQCIAL
jgi:hypothetical protein